MTRHRMGDKMAIQPKVKRNQTKTYRKTKYRMAKRRDTLKGLLFLSPWLIGFLAFTLLPFINSILYSFNAVSITPGKVNLKWEGLEYYDYAWNVSTSFKLSLSSSAMLICCATPVILVFSLIIAILLNNRFRGRTFFRAVFFMPVIIMSGPVISKLLTGYTVDFTDEGSQLMLFLTSLPSVVSNPCVFILDNLVLILWFSGVQILICLAGLQKVSPSLYEAAEIDGAGAWEKFWKITLPHMAPTILINAIYTVVTIANYSEQAVNREISENLFNTSMMYSLSAAMSWIYFLLVLLILAVVGLLFWLVSKKEKA